MKRMLQPNLIRIISMNLIAILQQHEGILRLEITTQFSTIFLIGRI